MARWKVWLRCLGQAVWAKAPRALIGLIPLGEQVFDVAADFRERLAKEQPLPDRPAALAELVVANPAEVQAEAQAIAASVAAGQVPEVQQKLTHYLQLVPLVTQQSLRRPEDPTGTTVPPRLVLDEARSLVPFIPPAPPRFLPGDAPASLHGWVLVRRLGAGGFGEVWQVRHPQSRNLHAAVKFCLDDKARAFLTHEKQVVDQVMSLKRLPGIVPLLDFDVQADPPYLMYEYIEGGDLLGVAQDFFGERATETIRQIAEVVGRFHRLDPPVVHRDLKPSNILVEKLPGGQCQLRVADFGIGGTAAAWALDQDRMRTLPSAALPTALLGSHTALYASRQQKTGCKPDPRDDVYALGILWYQLLIGDLTSEGPMGMWVEDLAEMGLSQELIHLLGRCVSAQPEKRPADAADLAEKIAVALLKRPKSKKTRDSQKRHEQPQTYEQQGLDAKAVQKVVPELPAKFTDIFLQMPFVLVPPGTFWMGSGGGKRGKKHVTIPQPFYLGVYPVTQGQWQALMGSNPSWFSRTGKGAEKVQSIPDEDLRHFPVECVSWKDVEEFIRRLNAREPDREWVYRLPTEAEWEYACRGGASSQKECSYHFYLEQPTNSLSSTQANFNGDYPEGEAAKGPSLQRTSKVGSYQPNRLGLFDMHGNVWEWCNDAEGDERVVRGGSWDFIGCCCGAGYRFNFPPVDRHNFLGFRLARVSSGN